MLTLLDRLGIADQVKPKIKSGASGMAAKLLAATQPKVSALTRYKLDGFSVERLMTFLTALDRDVQIVIKKKPRSRATGRISVEA